MADFLQPFMEQMMEKYCSAKFCGLNKQIPENKSRNGSFNLISTV